MRYLIYLVLILIGVIFADKIRAALPIIPSM